MTTIEQLADKQVREYYHPYSLGTTDCAAGSIWYQRRWWKPKFMGAYAFEDMLLSLAQRIGRELKPGT